LWFTADDGEPVGVAYCAPEAVTDGTWNLLMLWTRPDRSGRGFGSALVGYVEKALIERRARLLIVETSGLPDFETARAFIVNAALQTKLELETFSPPETIKSFIPSCCKQTARLAKFLPKPTFSKNGAENHFLGFFSRKRTIKDVVRNSLFQHSLNRL
jgi:hypothetical protein